MKPFFLILLSLFAINLASAQSNYATPYTFSTLAGAPPLSYPNGVAVDASGNIYVADVSNYIIRKITPAGEMTTLAGLLGYPGSRNDTGSAARFASPYGVAVDASGNVYVADGENHMIRKITPAGVVTTLAGLAGTSGSTDGTGSKARFNAPRGVAVDVSGNVYVADSDNQTIRKITPAGVVTTLAGLAGTSGSSDGTGSAALFSGPSGVAVDASGNVTVADTGNHAIRQINPAGVVTTLAGGGGFGSSDGTGNVAHFYLPIGVTVDASGNVYVADYINDTMRRITPVGTVTTLAGLVETSGSSDGTGSAARFAHPGGLAMDVSGNVIIADTENFAIRKMTPAGVVTTLERAGLGRDGTGNAARLGGPTSGAVDSNGNFYVAEYLGHTIRKITPAGVVSTLAGLEGTSGSSDGTGSAARFFNPSAVAVDAGDNVYVADEGNETIRKITPVGVVTTVAGLAGTSGSNDGTGSAARFHFPTGVAVDAGGNVFVADNTNHTIRQITPAGVVTTLAGLAGTSGSSDGTGTAALFKFPVGVAVDAGGNVLVADAGNQTIRKITPAGVVSTFAGLAGSVGSVDGAGTAARFNNPVYMAVKANGTVYVVDCNNQLIRKITPAGLVSTLAGLVQYGGDADGSGSVARFYYPYGIALDAVGHLYVADYSNETIRVGVATSLAYTGNATSIFGTAGVSLSYQATFANRPTGYSLTGTLPSGLSFNTTKGLLTGTPTQAGTFPLTLDATNGEGTGSVQLTLTIAKGAQTITFPTVGNLPLDKPYTLAATASSGLPVTYPAIHGPATLSGNQLTFTGAGTVLVKCRQGGNAGFLPAPDINVVLTVVKAAQTITFPTVGTLTYGTPYTLTATASSGLPVIYPAIHGPATLSGNQLTFTGAGTVVVKCRQGGDVSYLPATDINVTLTVNKATQTITAPKNGSVPQGTPYTLTATASSGLAVTYPSIQGPATVSGNQLIFTGAGLVVVKCRQAGNGNYAAAADTTFRLNVVATP